MNKFDYTSFDANHIQMNAYSVNFVKIINMPCSITLAHYAWSE